MPIYARSAWWSRFLSLISLNIIIMLLQNNWKYRLAYAILERRPTVQCPQNAASFALYGINRPIFFGNELTNAGIMSGWQHLANVGLIVHYFAVLLGNNYACFTSSNNRLLTNKKTNKTNKQTVNIEYLSSRCNICLEAAQKHSIILCYYYYAIHLRFHSLVSCNVTSAKFGQKNTKSHIFWQ